MSKKVLIIAIVFLVLSFGDLFLQEANSQEFVRRNQQRTGWVIDPGKSRYFLYVPDGRTARLTWRNSGGHWLVSNPRTVITVHYWQASRRRWVPMYHTSVDPGTRSFNLVSTTHRVPYLIVVRNYSGGTVLNMRVQ